MCYKGGDRLIKLYSGTPGSGKTFHAVKDVQWRINRGEHCIINFYMKPLNPKKAKYLHIIDTFSITPQFLYDFSRNNLKRGKESQALIVIDEAGLLFNSRDYAQSNRREWLKFMQVHRHFGFDILLISQFDRMIDRQIRCLIESESIHRSMKHYKIIGLILGLVFKGAFIAIEYWYGCKLLLGRSVFIGSKKIYKSYNTYDDWTEPPKKEVTQTKDLAPELQPAECVTPAL